MFRHGISSTTFYKTTENLNSDFTKNQHSHHRLPGPYALVEPSNGRPEHGRDINFSLTGIEVHNKSQKINTVSNPETRILGHGDRLSQHDFNFANGKSKELT